MLNRVAILILCLMLSACAGKLADKQPEVKTVPVTSLPELNEEFLYLAAQDAIRQGQGELAIRFLSALVKKRPDQKLPRLQLAEMLIRTNRPQEAIPHLNAVIGNGTAGTATTDESKDAQLLMARAQAMTNHREEALDILTELLNKYPELLEGRLLLVSILVSLERLDEAHFAIAQGLKLEKNPELYKTDAELYIRQNRLDRARRSLESVRKIDPDDETAVLLLSQIAQKENNQVKAEQTLRDYLDGHPESLVVRNALGRILVQSGRIKEAIRLYKGIVRDTGGTPDALFTLGLLYFQNGQYEEAADQFSKALDASGDDQARFYLAASLEAMDKKDAARAEYLKIAKGSPVHLDAQLRIAGLELDAEKADAAMKRIKSLISEYPQAGQPYAMLSAIYLAEERYRELIDETEPALNLPQISPRLLFNRAAAFEHFKAYDKVESSLQQLLKIDAKNIEALNFLGYIYAIQGIKLDEAESLIKRALNVKPDDGYYLDSLAWVYYKRGKFALAIQTQTRALKQVPDDPIMHEHMGDMLWKQGNRDKARSHWKKSLEFKHENPEKIRNKIDKGLGEE